MKIDIVRAGLLTTVHDLGRTGYRRFGVSLGGALDPHAMRVANLLVGNDESAAGLEITFGGVRIHFVDERLVAWCGGEFDVRIPAGHAARMRAGDELAFGQPKCGCRSWLAISGGIDVPVALGSRATDLRAGFGGLEGRALRDGDVVPLGQAGHATTAADISSWSAPPEWTQTAAEEPTLRIVRGSEWEAFEGSAHFALTNTHFDITPDSNRMGTRLEGPQLPRKEDVDLTSEAVAPGTIQVPANGQPIVLLGDCQTIGGYPKIAHVITVDLPRAAQLRPGDRVRFRQVTLAEAHELLREREHDFRCFKTGLSLQRA
ncbi:MAG: antagonist of KipI [Verrucomicrobiota bacterium]